MKIQNYLLTGNTTQNNDFENNLPKSIKYQIARDLKIWYHKLDDKITSKCIIVVIEVIKINSSPHGLWT